MNSINISGSIVSTPSTTPPVVMSNLKLVLIAVAAIVAFGTILKYFLSLQSEQIKAHIDEQSEEIKNSINQQLTALRVFSAPPTQSPHTNTSPLTPQPPVILTAPSTPLPLAATSSSTPLPPPPPPPPPSSSPASSGARTALLSAIQSGTQLRKTEKPSESSFSNTSTESPNHNEALSAAIINRTLRATSTKTVAATSSLPIPPVDQRARLRKTGSSLITTETKG